jgi:hypothetical protein
MQFCNVVQSSRDICSEVRVRPETALGSYTNLAVLRDNTLVLTARCWALRRGSTLVDRLRSADAVTCSASVPLGGRSRRCLCFQRCWHSSRWGLRPGPGEGQYSQRRPSPLTAWSDSLRLPSRERGQLKDSETRLDVAGAVRPVASTFAWRVSFAVAEPCL